MQRTSLRPPRRGVTLVELLVVVSIVLLLTAVAAPMLQQTMETRVTREAARGLNGFISSARYRALETGRPVGVLLEREPGAERISTLLRQVEVPAPYIGSSVGLVCLRTRWFSPDGMQAAVEARFQGGDIVDGIVRPGDRIVVGTGSSAAGASSAYTIGYAGLYHDGNTLSGGVIGRDETGAATTITSVTGDTDAGKFDTDGDYFIDFGDATADTSNWINNRFLMLSADVSLGQRLPWPFVADDGGPPPWSAPVPFQIIRQPVPTSAAPYQLPTGAVVDLDWSGANYPDLTSSSYSNDDERRTAFALHSLCQLSASDTAPVAIMFMPGGGIDYLYRNSTASRVTTPIYLLVGRRERVRSGGEAVPFGATADQYLAEDGLPNPFDLTNYWIALNAQTGLSTTNTMANAGVTSSNVSTFVDKPENMAPRINASRASAATQQGTGGR